MTLAHGGLGIAVIGIVAITAWRSEAIISMKPGEHVSVAGYDVTYLGDSPLTGANYTGDAGQFRITRDGDDVATVVSEKRQFQPGGMQTTEVGLHQMFSGDLYVVMGDRAGAEGRTVRVYFNPLVSLIWIGSLIMFFGGAVSLTDRRYRVGAPKPAQRQSWLPPNDNATTGKHLVALWLTLHTSCPCTRSERDAQRSGPRGPRSRALGGTALPCLPNQSIDESEAPLANDLRVLIRERLMAGDSDAAIMDFVVARYGEFVLLNPRFSTATALCGLGLF